MAEMEQRQNKIFKKRGVVPALFVYFVLWNLFDNSGFFESGKGAVFSYPQILPRLLQFCIGCDILA